MADRARGKASREEPRDYANRSLDGITDSCNACAVAGPARSAGRKNEEIDTTSAKREVAQLQASPRGVSTTQKYLNARCYLGLFYQPFCRLFLVYLHNYRTAI